MRMLKIVTVSAIAAAALCTAPAFAGEKQSFKHDGYTYVYEVNETTGGRTISGTRYPGAVPFSLTVHGDKVSGTTNGQSVAFGVDEARGAAAGATPVAVN